MAVFGIPILSTTLQEIAKDAIAKRAPKCDRSITNGSNMNYQASPCTWELLLVP